MMRQIGFFVLTLVVLVAAFIFLENSFSPPFQQCVTQHSQIDIANPAEKDPAGFGRTLTVYVQCTSEFIDANDGVIIAFATAIIAAFTFTLWRATSEQGRLTRMAIDDARKSNKREMRAYLSVVVGGADYQDRETNFKFAGYPILKNNGRTPAYKIRYWSKAEIIPDALIENYQFQIIPTQELSQASIGPGEDRILTCIVPEFVNYAEVSDIKIGKGKALWVWGTLHYEDAFGDSHHVNFSQRLRWLINGQVFGTYGHRFTDSD